MVGTLAQNYRPGPRVGYAQTGNLRSLAAGHELLGVAPTFRSKRTVGYQTALYQWADNRKQPSDVLPGWVTCCHAG